MKASTPDVGSNGHIQPLDGYQDVNGFLLVQLAEALAFEVTNLC